MQGKTERIIGNGVALRFAGDIPCFARRYLNAFGRASDGREAACSLEVSAGFSGRVPQGKVVRLDLCRMSEDFLEWKAQYKFAYWKYRLYKRSENDYSLEIEGDFFSQWAWPFRTVGPILRLLQGREGSFGFHAAGFYNGHSATLLFAPSGTGKTLTTLHYLCGGGKMYNDDTVRWENGKLQPSLTGLSFWEHRYRHTPEVLPENLPAFSAGFKRRQILCRFFNALSFGYLSLGARLPVKELWPGSEPPEAPVGKIVALRKGEEFRRLENFDKQTFFHRLYGDFEFQNLPLLRIAELETLTGYSLLGANRYLAEVRRIIDEELLPLPFSAFEVPARYSKALFESLKKEIE